MPDEYFKHIDDKHVSTEVDMLLWSPKLDLIALANAHGEVVLHRLSWQKVWTLAPPLETDSIGGLAWRPDSKVLAVGYRSGKIRLCDIEKGEILHATEVEGEVTCMCWTEQKCSEDNPFSSEPYGEDTSSNYLPKLQPLNKNYSESGTVSKDNVDEVVEDSKKLKDQKELNFLIVGTNKDAIHLIVYGVFPFAQASFMIQDGSQERRVCSAVLTDDLRSLSAVVVSYADESDEIDYYILSFDTTLIMSRHKEVRMLGLKYGLICCLVEHLQTTIQQMSEAWEDILTEMDSKLLKFAEEKKKTGQGTVSNDFLELLLFGTPSPELQNFLLHELTDKGLKKLGFSIETSYSNIQKLVVKHLQTVSQAIVYHLSELHGMALWFDKFGVLGLEPAAVQEAIKAAGSFVLACSDLQQVIDGSIKNFKAFFRWLYVVILRLSKEEVPAELGKVNQQQLDFVAEFLRDNFSHFIPEESHLLFDEPEKECEGSAASPLTSPAAAQKKPRFKMEKVGQYLKKEDLAHPSNLNKNPWVRFVQSSAGLSNSKVLYPVVGTKSLLQMQETLESKLEAALNTAYAQCFLGIRHKSGRKEDETFSEIVSPAQIVPYLFEPKRQKGNRTEDAPVVNNYDDDRTGKLGSMEVVGQSLQCSVTYHLFTLTDTQASMEKVELQPPKVYQFTDSERNQIVTIFTNNYLPHQTFFVLRQPTDISRVEEEDMLVSVRSTGIGVSNSSLLNDSILDSESRDGNSDEYSVLDLGQFDDKTITVLLASRSQDSRPALVQFPLASIPQSSYTVVNDTENIVNITSVQTVEMGSLVTHSNLQKLDNMHAHSMAVSLRKTATVLFHSRRRVRIFMMEEDEEEDDVDDTGLGEDSSLLHKSLLTDSSVVEEMEEGGENKENASMSGIAPADG